MTTIELGELGSVEAAAGPEMSGTTRRMLLAALVAVACLLGLGASVPVRPAFGQPLWSGTVSLVGFSLGTQSIYLAEPTGRVMFARDLRTGALRWRFEIDSLPLMSMDVGGGVAAVQTRIAAPAGQGTNTVMLVRETTGEVLGTASGNALGPATKGNRLLMLRTPELANDSCPELSRPCQEVSTVDITTGSVQHRLSLPGDTGLAVSSVDGRVDAYATYQSTGSIRVYDAGTGALLETMTQPDVLNGFVTLTPDALLTTRRIDDAIRVDAYRRGPLTPLWSRTLPIEGNPEYPTWWLAGDDCGRSICIRADSRTALLDRDTGETRFLFTGEILGSVGGGVLLGTQLLSDGPRGPQDVVVLDPVTGATLTTVGNAIGVWWQDSGGRMLLAQPGRDRTAFVVVDAAGTTRTLGSVDGVGLNCQARDAVLACAFPSGLLRVWSLDFSRR